jgi:hypothetical protein
VVLPPPNVWVVLPPPVFAEEVIYVPIPSICPRQDCPIVYCSAPRRCETGCCPEGEYPILSDHGQVCVPEGTQVDIVPGSNGCAGGCAIVPSGNPICLPQPAECPEGDCPEPAAG